MFLGCGRSLSTRREPTQTQREHANSTQKGPDPDSNSGPSGCKVTVLTITPMYHQTGNSHVENKNNKHPYKQEDLFLIYIKLGD